MEKICLILIIFFSKDSLSGNINNTWFNIFLNRIAIAQTTNITFLPYWNYFTHFNAWNWENLTNSNSYLLFILMGKNRKYTKQKRKFSIF